MDRFLSPGQVADFPGVIVDCRFNLFDADAGCQAYDEGHIPGARYLDLNRQMSAPVGEHGGRHPLPAPATFAETLAGLGIGADTPVLLYDDSRYAFAARCWWMMRALGYQPPQLLAGGFAAWCRSGGEPTQAAPRVDPAAVPPVPETWPGCVDRDGLRELQSAGVNLVDAREAVRYRGESEPIDPVAGHIPGAVNRPWQGFTDEQGEFISEQQQRDYWQDLADADPLVVYCGSGVSACVNLLSLSVLGRDDAVLYGGSWSDWCSYL